VEVVFKQRLFAHIDTVQPALFCSVAPPQFVRETINTPDNDFLDLDWMKRGDSRLLILTHGLEGSAHSTYSYRFTQTATTVGWDVLAWNFRGCSGRPNNLLRSYHSGFTDDLDLVLDHARKLQSYRHIGLIGISVGGNIVLKYLGEREGGLPSELCGAVAVSTPCDLQDAAETLSRGMRRVYLWYFLRSFRTKLAEKRRLFPGEISPRFFNGIKDFYTYDERYTAPLFGFRSVEEYWSKASSKPFISRIRLPTKIITAANDPFFSKACIPYAESLANKFISLEVPEYGGHVGFPRMSHPSWLPLSCLAFLQGQT
jgi:uncharacterized protein